MSGPRAEPERRSPTPREAAEGQILGARTQLEIREARRVMREWLEEHPEDEYYFGRGPAEQLHRIESYLAGFSEEELEEHDRKVVEERATFRRLKASGDKAALLRHLGIGAPDFPREWDRGSRGPTLLEGSPASPCRRREGV